MTRKQSLKIPITLIMAATGVTVLVACGIAFGHPLVADDPQEVYESPFDVDVEVAFPTQTSRDIPPDIGQSAIHSVARFIPSGTPAEHPTEFPVRMKLTRLHPGNGPPDQSLLA